MILYKASDVSNMIKRLRNKYERKKMHYCDMQGEYGERMYRLYADMMAATIDFKDEIIELNKSAVFVEGIEDNKRRYEVKK